MLRKIEAKLFRLSLLAFALLLTAQGVAHGVTNEATASTNEAAGCVGVKPGRWRAELSAAARERDERAAFNGQAEAWLCKALRAEEKAEWHGERAKVWADIAARQNSLGIDFATAREPLAEFHAETHRKLREKKLRAAQAHRRKARELAR
jgi:hypothetical protein